LTIKLHSQPTFSEQQHCEMLLPPAGSTQNATANTTGTGFHQNHSPTQTRRAIRGKIGKMFAVFHFKFVLTTTTTNDERLDDDETMSC